MDIEGILSMVRYLQKYLFGTLDNATGFWRPDSSYKILKFSYKLLSASQFTAFGLMFQGSQNIVLDVNTETTK